MLVLISRQGSENEELEPLDDGWNRTTLDCLLQSLVVLLDLPRVVLGCPFLLLDLSGFGLCESLKHLVAQVVDIIKLGKSFLRFMLQKQL